MERISINQLALLVLATLLLLTTKTVVGKISSTTPSEQEMRTIMDYNKMAIENFAARMMIMSQRPHIVEVKDEAQNKEEVGSLAPKKGLQCVSKGSYCNTFFGPDCCSNYLACVPWGLVGGVCVA
ncbi:unnamed protein product [Amaranthus hypochondriacus]